MLNRASVLPTAFLITLSLLLLCFINDTWPKFSGDVKNLFPRESETLHHVENAKILFGSAETDVLLVNFDNSDNRDDLAFLIDDLLQLDNILRVTGPISSSTQFPLPLISPDGKLARVLIEIESSIDDKMRERLDSSIQAILATYPQLKPMRTGQFALTQAVTRSVTLETLRKLPIAGGLLFLLLSYIFRSPVFAGKLLLAPVLSISWAMLLAALWGSSFGPISQLLPSFLLAVGTSYSVHVAVRVLESSSRTDNDTLAEIIKALSLAALTTAVGLISLLLLGVQGVTEFAIPGALGVALCYIFSLTISVDISKNFRATRLDNTTPTRLFRFDPAHLVKPIVVVPFLLIVFCLVPGVTKLSFSIDLNSFLPTKSEERIQLETIEKAFPGNHFIDIVFKNMKNVSPSTDAISKAKLRLASLEEVVTVVTADDFLSLTHSSDTTDSLQLDSFVTKDGIYSRLLVETGVQGKALILLRDKISQELDAIPSIGNFQVAISSIELLLAEQAKVLLRGLIQSLGATLIVLMLLLILIFRDWRVVCIGLLPNIIPVATIFGLAGFVFGEVNIGTAEAGAIALGIAADDTFHLLFCWKQFFQKSNNSQLAARDAIRTTFGAMLTTSMVLTGVFLVLGGSDIVPIQHYGLLISGMLFVGLCADLILVPYFLEELGGFRARS